MIQELSLSSPLLLQDKVSCSFEVGADKLVALGNYEK